MLLAVFSTFAISLFACFLVIFSGRTSVGTHFQRTDLLARQAAHVRPTPRIGGLPLAASVVLVSVLIGSGLLDHHSAVILFSALPVFLVGLREDMYRDVSSKARYGAAILSGFLALSLLGFWIDRGAPDWFGALMAVAPIGIALTVFTTASYSHAFNLIDGLNGLCSGTSILIASGLAVVALQSGHPEFVPLLMIIAAGLSGFFLWNFPFGRIFLGDAGAYSIGHILSWIGVALIATTTDVSPWAIMLIFFWPLADTLFAIYRRASSGQPIDQPDRMHFHQLVMRALQMTILGRNAREKANPLATLALLPLIGITVATGVVFWDNDAAAGIALVVYAVLFVGLHRVLRIAARQMRLRLARRRART